jgi:hypothetical protein
MARTAARWPPSPITSLDYKQRLQKLLFPEGHTTIESFASNRSSWTMTAGRGFPA